MSVAVLARNGNASQAPDRHRLTDGGDTIEFGEISRTFVMFAVIDLGSNSFHLLIAEITANRLAIVSRCSNKIQLAEGLSQNGRITPAAMERGIHCLRQFKQILSEYPIKQIQVVATQALRQALNAQDFIDLALAEGFNIDIIDGRREAGLIFRGVTDPLLVSEQNRLVIDIGGASTEIAIGNNQQILFAESLTMGCVSWRDRFFKDTVSYRDNGQQAKAAVRSALQPLLDKLTGLSWAEVYASSGSAKMMAHIAYANQWSRGEITQDCIRNIETALANVKHYADIQLDGLDPNRMDLLAPGLSILSTIMEQLNIPTVLYSYTALREGLLSEISQHRVDSQLIPAEETLL